MSHGMQMRMLDASVSEWRHGEIRNLADIPRHWGKQRPAHIALKDGDHSTTYAELDALSNRIANALLDRKIRPSSNIGYLGRNSAVYWAGWFGAVKARCTYAPFNWRCSVVELIEIFRDSQTPLVIVSSEFAETARQILATPGIGDIEVVLFDPATSPTAAMARFCGEASSVDPALEACADDGVLLSYTSGTTGTPKGVLATQEAFAYSHLCNALEPDWSWSVDDKFIMSMPNFHLGGSWVTLTTLYHGAQVIIMPAFEPAGFMALLRRERATMAALVPIAIRMLIESEGASKDDFASLHSITYFGSPVDRDTLSRAQAMIDCGLKQSYGTTETYFLTMLGAKDHREAHGDRLRSCGRPLPLVEIAIRDPNGAALANGLVGELFVRTPMVMAGYWNRAATTAEVLDNGWYRTGDLGYRDADGYIFIVDRAKDMIISGGENVYSAEVEKVLAMLDGVSASAVIGLPDEKWGERVTAVIVAQPGSVLDEAAVISHCRAKIAAYKAPKQVIFARELPMTPTGKVQKAALRKQLMAQMDAD